MKKYKHPMVHTAREYAHKVVHAVQHPAHLGYFALVWYEAHYFYGTVAGVLLVLGVIEMVSGD